MICQAVRIKEPPDYLKMFSSCVRSCSCSPW